CSSCHDGTKATGKPPTHIPTTLDCDSCHVTTAWIPARFDHTGVMPGTCIQCHDGVRATGKTPTHIATTASCDACHSTIAWIPARFDHANVAPGTCSQCHNGTSATGKPGNHWLTTLECDSCHSTMAWTPVSYRHVSGEYPGDHSGPPACIACHTTNRDAATWKFPQYRPDCAGCHVDDYKEGPHKKVDQVSKYTVGELRDCSGACHVYTDATLTTILKLRPGPKHRAMDADW
ncbi:MAG: hypothetical protein WAW79_00400, partial [Steroidobacteraceae bacterium]